MKRTDAASRVVAAPRETLYQAFVDPQALVSWLPPAGMTAKILVFDPRAGGAYRLALTHDRPGHTVPGKTTAHTDVVEGRFLELVPDERVVQSVAFQSDDPAFAGEMKMTWSFDTVRGGTEVTIVCENVPEGIRQEDHIEGFRSTLENLAAHTE